MFVSERPFFRNREYHVYLRERAIAFTFGAWTSHTRTCEVKLW